MVVEKIAVTIRRPIPKKKIVLNIVLKIVLRSNFDSVTCANY